MSNELLEALNILEQEKNISKETLLEAIENSLVTACKNHCYTERKECYPSENPRGGEKGNI